MRVHLLGIATKIRTIVFLVTPCMGSFLFAQSPVTEVSGLVTEERALQPIPFAVVAVPDTKTKSRTDEKGRFVLQLPPGKYTVFVQAPGYRFKKVALDTAQSKTWEVALRRVSVRGAAIVVKDERKIQKVSRYTMTAQEMKEIPASFGDSVSALTAMAGINRTAGFFGNLTIRGMNPNFNRYYIDDIPMYSVLHFGGLHSVINTNLIRQIDVYSSAYPARFTGGVGALINIETIDDIQEFGGIADANLISTNALIAGPFTRDVSLPPEKEGDKTKVSREFIGYWIASGRYGNLSIAKAIADLLNEKIDSLPVYYDYQIKGKYFFDKSHSLTAFFFGSADFLKIISEVSQNEIDEGADPLFNDIEFKTDNQFHNQSLAYQWLPSKKFSNKMLLYSSLNKITTFAYRAGTFLDVDVVSRPNIYGARNITRWEYWKNTSEIEAIAEANYYDYFSRGKTIVPANPRVGFDLGDKDAFVTTSADTDGPNKTLGGSLSNRFTFGVFTLVPSVRADYLSLNQTTTVDPRGLASVKLPSLTTISLAGGSYSSFIQNNPFLFVSAPEVSKIKEALPQKAIHSAFGVEQEFLDLYTAKLELFYNTFSNLAVPNAKSNPDSLGESKGDAIAYGAEVTLRKDTTTARDNEMFGWVSYTYTQSKEKTGVASDPAGNKFVSNRFEQEHVLKLVAGYFFGGHTITAKFQLYTSFPYTPIVADDGNEFHYNPPRYAPLYDGQNPYSAHFPPSHRLDVRYSYQASYKWGHIKWYVEVINVYAFAAINNEKWKYNHPYEPGVNPTLEKDKGFLAIPLPNLGVEVKF